MMLTLVLVTVFLRGVTRFGFRRLGTVFNDLGIFDVVVDGRLVFSKFEAGRFPEDQEILDALRGS